MKIVRYFLAALLLALFGKGAVLTAGYAQSGDAVPLSEVSHIHGISVDQTDPERLYLATHYGVWRTSPDGTAEQVSDNSNDYMGFSPHPTEPGRFLASGHPVEGGNMGVIVSEDGARTWRGLAEGVNGPVDFHAMDISPADPNRVYGLYGSIQVSRNGGESWEVAGSVPADVFDLAASAVDPDVVYAATRGGVMISRDAGQTWQDAGAGPQPASMVETGPDGTAYAFVLGAGLVKTPASVLDWQPVANTFGERILVHLAVDPGDRDRMFAVTETSEIRGSVDGGTNWTALGS